MPEKPTAYEQLLDLMGELSCEVATLDLITQAAMDGYQNDTIVEALIGLNSRVRSLYLKMEQLCG